ncbi:hypothetical protein SFAG_02440 [Staphylococcus aureus subsp. aureus C160]|nr:hypothetical protein NB74_01590 [Staphylococcus aureus]EFB99997.1 hypothetical protein SFAG_02440 [Staphylococcus aureus subsp. aureus C160]KPM72008.1 hypothetical protein MZ09_04145 [Staphylococcus aureus]KPM72159.1 hypothetical protein AM595_08220 [Staphylococcus aureus]KQB68205.1 hypothetical protein AL076_01565 [Staphylococcus aureus]
MYFRYRRLYCLLCSSSICSYLSFHVFLSCYTCNTSDNINYFLISLFIRFNSILYSSNPLYPLVLTTSSSR